MIAETIAQLKVRRERAGLSIEQVAKLLEVTRVTLWRWETGRGPRKIRKSTIRAWESILESAEERGGAMDAEADEAAG